MFKFISKGMIKGSLSHPQMKLRDPELGRLESLSPVKECKFICCCSSWRGGPNDMLPFD